MFDKTKYREILDYFKEEIGLALKEIKSLLYKNDSKLSDDLAGFLFAKSKRLRPVMVFLTADMLNYKITDGIISLAAALELLHSATLIHDDIIDDASMRRQTDTLNSKYNPKIAVLAGDYILSLCLLELSKINSPVIFNYFSYETMKVCRGEIDQFFNKNKIISIEDYIEKSKNKTASLFMAGVKSVISLIEKEKRVPASVKNAILEFTEHFALGFQIYDDIENFLNMNTDKISSDIKNGIYTLPVLYLSQQKKYCDIIEENKKGTKAYQDALDYSKKYLNNTLDGAVRSLNTIEGNFRTDMLIKLAEAFKMH